MWYTVTIESILQKLITKSDTTESLLKEHCKRLHWTQPLLFAVGETVVDFFVAIGPGCETPAGAIYQHSAYPNNRRYLFDPSKYSGVESLEQLTANIKSCCHQCKLYSVRPNKGIIADTYSLRCSYYRVQDEQWKGNFLPGKFTQESVPTEQNK